MSHVVVVVAFLARIRVVAGVLASGDLGSLLGSALRWPGFLVLASPTLAFSSALLSPLPEVGVHAWHSIAVVRIDP